VLVRWLSSTGHKVTGHLYLITSFGFVLTPGLMA
jgi:cytochrome c oxidase subunit 1